MIDDKGIPETVSEAADLGIRVHICAGPPKCSGRDGPCPWCYVVEPGDERTTEQIIEDMQRGQLQ